MTSKILLCLLALAALLVAPNTAQEVTAFVCDHHNKIVTQQAVSPGKVTRICIQAREFSLHSLDALMFTQQGSLAQESVADGQLYDRSISELHCADDIFVFETYLEGDFFLLGAHKVTMLGRVALKMKTNQLRGNNQHLPILSLN
jgi:hypothetical protein